MVMARKSMGDYMLEKGYASQSQIEEARKIQQTTKQDLARILIEMGINPVHVYEAKAQEMGVAFVNLTTYKPDPSAINVVPDHVAKAHNVLPVKKDGQVLYVAMGDVNNLEVQDTLRMVSRCQIRPVLAVPDQIEQALTTYYGGGVSANASSDGAKPSTELVDSDARSAMAQAMAEYGARGDAAKEVDEESDLRELVDQAPIVRLAATILQQAIKERASDIHIEPDRRGVRVRYRIDGVLHEIMQMPAYLKLPLVARYKILSEMNIAERRVPQDGRIATRYQGKEYDLRVSCLPNLHGEKIVMRILDKSSVMIGLNKLGFLPEVQAQLEELASQPNGMILSTGPTGHGKTTTQYSLLNKLNTVEKNILTIEDPVEYVLSGVTQVQVNRKAGLTFATALRAFLRQDPDIIMVGEMRDLETAEIAIEAALTGHLVLSTLHTNDAPSATIRLIDMGVEPFLISATVIGVLAQRLARRICNECKEFYEAPASDLRKFGFKVEDPAQTVQLARGRGCEACRYTGYRGRIGIYELMRVNAEIAEMIVRRAPLADLKEAAKANGMMELREDGLAKVLQGITTPEEVMRTVFTAGY
ncbi:type II secretion system protein E (GspE) [Chthonomonas calidirosea]|uniref:Type II secretion system protein E (GspE) n=1 Tax=Chthonomonas calidirosea (strain DSM 23976 / ICMP 18418 / T49) TaxID=1303518 RepID=S0EUK1_CHTCT|nr:ATPase, T2SS/T4P/T4SS family [Chthonomonas calidirosea]CCW35010.1 type II secretion system protein E (GspE) [Chthonomonas calidirosea T49]CEK20975.1 type II secretion system protein E (GspE) [Chthonomonas calidirosea]